MNPALKLLESPEEAKVDQISEESASLTGSVKELKIVTQADYERAAELLKVCKLLIKEVDETFDEPCSDAHSLWKKLTGKRKEKRDPLEKIETFIKKMMGSFVDAQEKARLAEQAKLRAEEARRAEDERLAHAAELEALGDRDGAEAALNEESYAPLPEVIKAKTSVAGSSTKKVWAFEIFDRKQIPEEYKTIDEGKIRKVIQALGEDANIPGVRAFQKTEIATRL